MDLPRALALTCAISLGACTFALPYDEIEPEDDASGTCQDGLDNDLDGLVDEHDTGCTADERNAELCSDGRDNDADGLVDYRDVGCWPFADVVVKRCSRIQGVRISPPFADLAGFWTGSGEFVERGDGWALEADGAAGALLLLPEITGVAQTLTVQMDLVLTNEAFPLPSQPIVSVLRGRDVAGSAPPTPDALPSVQVRTGVGGSLFGLVVSDAGRSASQAVGTAETGAVRVTLSFADLVPHVSATTATQEVEVVHGQRPEWGQFEPLRLVFGAPPGVHVSELLVQTDSASACSDETDGPQFQPPRSRPRALAASPEAACLVLAEASGTSTSNETAFVRGALSGTRWEGEVASGDFVSCAGLLWDEDAEVFRALCAGPGAEMTVAESRSCGGDWDRSTRPGVEGFALSRIHGFTRYGSQHEVWTTDSAGLHRWTADGAFRWTETPEVESLAAAAGVLALDDGSSPLAQASFFSVHRAGRDRIFLVGDGVRVSLFVATGLEGQGSVLRRAFDPLLTPTGVLGTFDAELLTYATVALLPAGDDAGRLLLAYSGAAHCVEESCGVHSGTAEVTIRAP